MGAWPRACPRRSMRSSWKPCACGWGIRHHPLPRRIRACGAAWRAPPSQPDDGALAGGRTRPGPVFRGLPGSAGGRHLGGAGGRNPGFEPDGRGASRHRPGPLRRHRRAWPPPRLHRPHDRPEASGRGHPGSPVRRPADPPRRDDRCRQPGLLRPRGAPAARAGGVYDGPVDDAAKAALLAARGRCCSRSTGPNRSAS